MQTLAFVGDKAALSWANEQFPFTEHKLIRDFPWSRIFELKESSKIAYLKLVPLRQLQVLKTNTTVSQHFQSITPETIGFDEELGLQLSHHHGGIELGSFVSENQNRLLLTTYAKMQAEAKEMPKVLSSIPEFQLKEIVTNFLEFLKPEEENAFNTEFSVKADFFFGSEESQEYYDVFLERKELLEEFIKNADLLPNTLNHCDLRTENVAERNDGSSIIYDWDDALIGPAGLSLQAMFEGCFDIYTFLNKEVYIIEDEELLQEEQLLNAYINELEKQGYSSLSHLQKAIPASSCAGAMQAIVNYAQFPLEDDLYVFDVKEYLVRRLDDLLKLCDHLSCSNRASALLFAKDYQERDIAFRAEVIYKHYLEAHPNDFAIHKKLVALLRKRGKWEEAIKCLDIIIKHNPGDVESFNQRGIILLKNNKPNEAIVDFELALSKKPRFKRAQINRDKAAELLNMIDLADRPNKLPTAQVSVEEKKGNTFSSEKVDTATSLFNKYGALVVEDVFDVDMLQAIKKMILDKYDAYFEPKDYDDCLRLGDKRHMVTLDIEGPINSPNLYDNPFVSPLIKKILGDDYILGAMNIGVSLPGSKNQSIHKDYPSLFPESDEFRDNLPCFAMGLLIPLVQHSHVVGTTLVIKESQRISHDETDDLPAQAPFLDIGSGLMIDYRVGHQGLANSSEDVVRPLLSLLFHRSWFRDCINYRKQAPITIDDAVYEQSPERLKELISWAKGEAVINPMKLEDEE